MHISRIELENIKSHESSAFELSRGTTAITGPNGAGKSTIVEAIAWALFDLLEYKKEDFVRRGSDRGRVSVTIVSSLDEREYIVYRDTGAAYHVTDPRLHLRIANKKEEVFRFLWQHLGLEPGTDLRSLFRQAIGVPQGTLTAIFLEGAVERKTAFDRLLKVEEYRQAAEKLRETARFLDIGVAAARESIARAEGELSRHEKVADEHRHYADEATRLAGEIEANQREQDEAKGRLAVLDKAEKQVAELTSAFDRLRVQVEKAEIVADQYRKAVAASQAASENLERARPMAERHIEVLGKLKDLERQRAERDRLTAEISRIDTAVTKVEAERDRLTGELKAVQAAHGELATLGPEISRQESLDAELKQLRERASSARIAKDRVAVLDEKLVKLRERYKAITEKIRLAEQQIASAGDLSGLESRNADLMRHLAEMRAALDRDERFQAEIKDGLCPVLSQRCLNLAEGQTLDGFLSSQFTEVRTHIAELESQRTAVEASLAAARAAANLSAALDGYRQQAAEITDEGKELGEEQRAAAEQAAELEAIEQAIATAEQSLKKLDDPKGRTKFLEKQIESEPVIRTGLSETESTLERLHSERNQLVEQIDPFRHLNDLWKELSAEREATDGAYRSLLTNEAEAGSLAERRAALDAAETEAAGLKADLGLAKTAMESAVEGYDREHHTAERTALRELENAFHSARARLDAARSQESKLAAELERFAAVRGSLLADNAEKERLEAVCETTAFIRETLKEAAPRVARNYVYHVSLEANQLFREITGNAERTLKWNEDYSVTLEEDGYERPFASLSGGEQMAAALAVRLGLLKQLTDIRLAFFDEPTANMDAERRDNLGQQISRITHFDQLIVISHDDTFDSYVDNVISLG